MIYGTRSSRTLRQLGIRSGQSRSTALFQFATGLPAAILARLLGIHVNVADTWQRVVAGSNRYGWPATGQADRGAPGH
jgi:hypothetical protein